MKLPKRVTRANAGWGLVLAGGIGLLVSVFLLFNPQVPQPPKSAKAPDTSQAAPSSVKPTAQAVATYTVPAPDPKYLSIPAINITNARIIRLGLLKNGQIATPDNVFDTGWYDASSEPGQSGAMFIYGHVSSWTADGVFYNLKKLQAGDLVTVTRGDNTTFTYRVTGSKVYPANSVDMNEVLSPVDPGRPGLNLMTCTGQVIPGTSEFNERLVVFTTLV